METVSFDPDANVNTTAFLSLCNSISFATNHPLVFYVPTDSITSVLCHLLEHGVEIASLAVGVVNYYYTPAPNLSPPILRRLLASIGESSTITRLSLNQIMDPTHSFALPIGLSLALERSLTLDELVLGQNDCSLAGLSQLSAAMKRSSIRRFSLNHPKLDLPELRVLSDSLFSFRKIISIKLKQCDIGDAGAEIVAEQLIRNRTVERLVLGNNMIGCAGAGAIAGSLVSRNNTLADLDLDSNEIGRVGTKALADMLAVNIGLVRLRLSHNKIGKADAKVLIKGFMQNHLRSRLKEIHLGGNRTINKKYCTLFKAMLGVYSEVRLWRHIKEPGLRILVFAARRSREIGAISLNGNRISDAGACILAEGLLSGTSVRFLEVTRNQVGDLGAAAFATALEGNATLEELSLDSNEIADEGARTLGRALGMNKTLKRLGLSGNKIGRNGARTLVKAANEHNATLAELSLEANDGAAEIKADAVAPLRLLLRIRY